jgi:hypothetical protein
MHKVLDQKAFTILFANSSLASIKTNQVYQVWQNMVSVASLVGEGRLDHCICKNYFFCRKNELAYKRLPISRTVMKE